MPSDQSPVLPSSFLVIFPARRCAGSPADYYPTAYTKSVALADIGYTDLAGAPGNLGLRSTAYALYSSTGGPPSNQAALDALATQMATDYAAWRSQLFDTVFNGVLSPDPSALNDDVEICYHAGDAWTRTTSAPLGSEAEEFQHQDPAVTGCVDSTGVTVAKLPAIEVDIPDGKGGQMHGLLSIEGGRLVMRAGTTDSSAGCACSGGSVVTKSVLFTVKGCNNFAARLVLISILASDGHTYTGTTNSSGQVTIAVPLGSATITYTSPLSRFAVLTQTTTITNSTSSINATLVAASGYFCCPLWAIPMEETLYFTDANGTHLFAITTPPDTGSCFWNDCYMISMPNVLQIDNPAGCTCKDPTTSTGFPFQFNGTSGVGGNININMNVSWQSWGTSGLNVGTGEPNPPVNVAIQGCTGGPPTPDHCNCGLPYVFGSESMLTNILSIDPYTPPPYTLTWAGSVPDGCPVPVSGTVTIHA